MFVWRLYLNIDKDILVHQRLSNVSRQLHDIIASSTCDFVVKRKHVCLTKVFDNFLSATFLLSQHHRCLRRRTSQPGSFGFVFLSSKTLWLLLLRHDHTSLISPEASATSSTNNVHWQQWIVRFTWTLDRQIREEQFGVFPIFHLHAARKWNFSLDTSLVWMTPVSLPCRRLSFLPPASAAAPLCGGYYLHCDSLPLGSLCLTASLDAHPHRVTGTNLEKFRRKHQTEKEY